MRIVLAVLISIALATTALADFSRVGSAGAQFLKIGVGSRYQGMGEASVAVANDIYAAYWNPAGLATLEGSQIAFTNVNWLLDIDLNHFAYGREFEDLGIFALSATVLSMGSQEITTFEEQGGTGQTYSASSVAVGLSYARQLTSKFAFGATAKYVTEKIHLEQSSGIGFDFGTMLYTGYRTLRLGMSISNIGPQMKFTGPDLKVSYDPQNGQGANDAVGAELITSDYNLPLTFRVGLAFDMEVGPKNVVVWSAELKHPNDNVEQGALGAEWGFDNKFFLRGGYKLNTDEEGLALGGGLRTSITQDTKLFIDYSWQDFGRLESAQRFSVGFSF